MLTTVQDLGRADYQVYGISAGGAMDALSLRLANMLAGNKEDDAALEVTLTGPELKFVRDGIIAIAGGDLCPELNGKKVSVWRTFRVAKGDILNFKQAQDGGCRAYIAAAGGIDVPLVMGSRSTFIRGSYGGFHGRALKAGDVISAGISRHSDPGCLTGRSLPPDFKPDFREERPVRFILGPQADAFTEDTIQAFTSSGYTISNQSDRMGYRLEGNVLAHINGPDIISDYITVGSIQIPGDGQPIVLMADCQMTGGYTKIGVVISTDLPYLAQKKPGDTVRFEQIGIDQAHRLWKQQEQRLSLLKINNL
ncbi:biotin-dependent carboxyltransferase family protein [Paenibacillus piri]|nr:biotin-dependent carboxyltransferase family protein [Paenibacillus piri]